MLGFGIVGHGVAADVTGTSTLFAVHTAKPMVHPAIQNLRYVVPPQADCAAWSRTSLDEFSRIYRQMLGFRQES